MIINIMKYTCICIRKRFVDKFDDNYTFKASLWSQIND